MKKLGLVFVAFLAVFSLTGCGGKKLKCTRTEDNSKETIAATFKKDKLVKFQGEMVETYETEEEAEEQYGYAQLASGMMGSVDGIEIKLDKSGKKVTMKVTADLTKDGVSSLMDLDVESMEDYKKSMEEEGYTCK